jgi:hypothetical protein
MVRIVAVKDRLEIVDIVLSQPTDGTLTVETLRAILAKKCSD